MIQEQIDQITDKIRAEAARRFRLDPKSIKTLDGFENVVLEATREGEPYIIRLSHPSHRKVDQVHAELHWLDYLAQNKVSVCKPLRSINDSLIECFEIDSGEVVAVAFEKAKGGLVKREDFTPQMTYNRGRLLGKMHALTKNYQPISDTIRRPKWWDDDDFVIYRQFLSEGTELIAERFDTLVKELRTIAHDRDSFGLIHMDAHHGNIFFDGDNPTIFDFDDCHYDFFISDLAISLFYAVHSMPDGPERTDYAAEFLDILLDGYRAENQLDNCWRDVIPMILKRRQILLYVALYRGFGEEQFDDWCRTFLARHRPLIENQTPFLDLDWTRFDLGG